MSRITRLSPFESAIAAARRRPFNNLCVALGDSLTDVRGTSYPHSLSYSWFDQLCISTDQQVQFAGIYATPGYRVDQLQSVHLPSVLALPTKPGACVIFSGTNDILQDISFATSKANLKAIATSLLGAGIVPILVAIPPVADTTPHNAASVLWNTFIRWYAGQNGFPLIDAYSAVVAVGGGIIAAYDNGDQVHLNPTGHKAIAQQAIDDGVHLMFPASAVKGSKSTADLSNLLGSGSVNYGLFTADADSDGTADGLTAYGTGTPSLVTPTAADNLQGNWQQFARTTGQTGSAGIYRYLNGWSPGDTIAFSARIQTDDVAATLTQLSVGIQHFDAGGPTVQFYGPWGGRADFDGTIYVEFPVPAGTTFLVFYAYLNDVFAAGNPTFRVGEVTIRNLTTQGVMI